MVIPLPLNQLHTFSNHPFKIQDNDAIRETVESVKEYGVLKPAIVRPHEDGRYEIITGHRRYHASELVGLKTMPALVRNMDDNTSTILMVVSNLQRENILPASECRRIR